VGAEAEADVIYFIQAGKGGPIKIGHTRNPITRIESIALATAATVIPLSVVPGERGDELGLHAAFSHLRIKGEWFTPARDLLDYIASLPPYRRTPVITAREFKEWRAGTDMTQAEAAAWLRVRLRTYQKWEQGVRLPTHIGAVRHRMGSLRRRCNRGEDRCDG
jgi:DNA-binding XRE family transcriptional regulator